MPWRRAGPNASSRLGPWVPFVLARRSVWQLPQVALPTKSSLPRTRSGGWSARPQPLAAKLSAPTAAAAAMRVQRGLKAAGRLSAGDLGKRVQPTLRGRDHPAGHRVPAVALPGRLGQRRRGLGALGLIELEPRTQLVRYLTNGPGAELEGHQAGHLLGHAPHQRRRDLRETGVRG